MLRPRHGFSWCPRAHHGRSVDRSSQHFVTVSKLQKKCTSLLQFSRVTLCRVHINSAQVPVCHDDGFAALETLVEVMDDDAFVSCGSLCVLEYAIHFHSLRIIGVYGKLLKMFWMAFVSFVFSIALAVAVIVDDLFSTSNSEGAAFDAHHFAHSCIIINGHWRPVVCSQRSVSNISCEMGTLSKALVFISGCGSLRSVNNFTPLNSRICPQFLPGEA